MKETYFAIFALRSEAELNRCTGFCRPLPNRSAIGPNTHTNYQIEFCRLTRQSHTPAGRFLTARPRDQIGTLAA